MYLKYLRTCPKWLTWTVTVELKHNPQNSYKNFKDYWRFLVHMETSWCQAGLLFYQYLSCKVNSHIFTEVVVPKNIWNLASGAPQRDICPPFLREKIIRVHRMLGVTNPWILPKLSRLCNHMNAIAYTEWIMDNECFIPHILLLFMNCPVANHISHNHLLSNFHKLVLVCSSIAHSTLLLIIIINWFLHRLVLLTLRWQNIAFFSPGGVNIACRSALQ